MIVSIGVLRFFYQDDFIFAAAFHLDLIFVLLCAHIDIFWILLRIVVITFDRLSSVLSCRHNPDLIVFALQDLLWNLGIKLLYKHLLLLLYLPNVLDALEPLVLQFHEAALDPWHRL